MRMHQPGVPSIRISRRRQIFPSRVVSKKGKLQRTNTRAQTENERIQYAQGWLWISRQGNSLDAADGRKRRPGRIDCTPARVISRKQRQTQSWQCPGKFHKTLHITEATARERATATTDRTAARATDDILPTHVSPFRCRISMRATGFTSVAPIRNSDRRGVYASGM
jgi:hypothetical protein